MASEQIKDGEIEEGEVLTSPLTLNELNASIDNMRVLYGTTGSDGQVKLKETWAGRLSLGFRSWIVPKKDLYYRPNGSVTKAKGRTVWVEDKTLSSGGYYEFQSMTDEGIVQTVAHLARIMKAEQLLIPPFSKLDLAQKDNIAKLAGHISVFAQSQLEMTVSAGSTLIKTEEHMADVLKQI